jgi:hypothetical protein
MDANKFECTYHETVRDILYLIALKQILIFIFTKMYNFRVCKHHCNSSHTIILKLKLHIHCGYLLKNVATVCAQEIQHVEDALLCTYACKVLTVYLEVVKIKTQ